MKQRDLPEFIEDALAECDPETAARAAELATEIALSVGHEAPAPELKARLFKSLEGEQRYAPFFDRIAALIDVSASRVQEFLRQIDDASAWVPGPMPGIQLIHLSGGPAVATADVGIVQITAGFEFPHHRHVGLERVLILEGEYQDSSGAQYGPGDVHVKEPNTEHSFRVLSTIKFVLVLEQGIEIPGVGILNGQSGF